MTLPLATTAIADVQQLSVKSCSVAMAGKTVSCQIQYNTDNQNKNLTGLGFRLHSNNKALHFKEIKNLYKTGLVSSSKAAKVDQSNADNDEKTNEFLSFAWSDTGGTWPGEGLPTTLFDVVYTIDSALNVGDTTTLNFSKIDTAVGYQFKGDPYVIKLQASGSQVVEVESCTSGKPGDIISCAIKYNTSDNNLNLNGLSFRLHYDDHRLTLQGIDKVLKQSKTGYDKSPLYDGQNKDKDTLTNQYLQFAWGDPSASWPGGTVAPTLFNIRFKVNENLKIGDTTKIKFSASEVAWGYSFIGKPHTVTLEGGCQLDIDGNGEAKALTDGLLILRYLFDFNGDTLINGVIAPKGATRSTAAAVTAYLDKCRDSFDIDDSSEVKALTDGLLMLRYLFGFQGETLVSKATADNAKRTTATAIEAFLKPLKEQ